MIWYSSDSQSASTPPVMSKQGKVQRNAREKLTIRTQMLSIWLKRKEIGFTYIITVNQKSAYYVLDLFWLARGASAYFCGHLHMMEGLEMYTRHRSGTFEVELGDWKLNRMYVWFYVLFFFLFCIFHFSSSFSSFS